MATRRLAESTRTARWARFACAWCAGFAALHFYWAVGGDIGLAESAGADLAARRPAFFVLVGLYGMGVILLSGAVFAAAFACGWPRGRLRRPAVLVAWLVGTVLLVRGVVVELVLLTDAAGIASAVGSSQTRWSLVLWNPWFMLGGVAFLLAAHRSGQHRRSDDVPRLR